MMIALPRLVSTSTVLTLAVLSLTSPVLAKEKKPMDPNKRVCHTEVATGTRFAKATCHTLAEWASIDGTNASDARSTLDGLSRAGIGGVASTSDAGK